MVRFCPPLRAAHGRPFFDNSTTNVARQLRVSARFVWKSFATFASESPFQKNAKVSQESQAGTRVKPRKTPTQLDRRTARTGRLLRRFNGAPRRARKSKTPSSGRTAKKRLLTRLAARGLARLEPRRRIPNRRPRSAARVRQNVPIDARPRVVAMTVAWLAQLRRTVVPLAPVELATAGAAAEPVEHRTTAVRAAIVGAARTATFRAIGAVASCSACSRRWSAIAAA
jgi:hypothetical protein